MILCENCGVDAKLYRCCECIGEVMLCLLCLNNDHKRLPLHRIEVSNAPRLWLRYADILKVMERTVFPEDVPNGRQIRPTNGT